MNDAFSERRMIENESVFRRKNESVQKEFRQVQDQAIEDNQEYLIPEDDTILHFYCECSDEKCRVRILMKPSEYTKIHKNRNRFVILNGHDTKLIEKVIRRDKDFWIVEKFIKPPEVVHTLQPTGLDNG